MDVEEKWQNSESVCRNYFLELQRMKTNLRDFCCSQLCQSTT